MLNIVRCACLMSLFLDSLRLCHKCGMSNVVVTETESTRLREICSFFFSCVFCSG